MLLLSYRSDSVRGIDESSLSTAAIEYYQLEIDKLRVVSRLKNLIVLYISVYVDTIGTA